MSSKIVTLCGSARFEPHWHHWNKLLTLAGHTVFSLGCFPSVEGGKDWYNQAQKRRLDAVHKLKIQRSDAVVVLNVGGYIGESTLAEIEHAHLLGAQTYALESWGKGCGLEPPGQVISTVCCNKWRFVFDLFGEAGPERSSLAGMDEAFKSKLKGPDHE